jgi:hypothetical protein
MGRHAGEGSLRPGTESFGITELVGLFREALIALLPVMDKSRIQWREGRTYDPWEDIERTLYYSIIGSCVENAVPPGCLRPLAPYGHPQPSYTNRSFLVASDERSAAFVKLGTGSEPFDEAILLELDANLAPTTNRFRKALAGTDFMIATPNVGGGLAFGERIVYVA